VNVSPPLLVLYIGLLLAAFTDVRWGRIPNALTMPMMALGIVMHLTLGPDPWFGLIGCAAAFALHFSLFALGLEKAGDAKLLMGLGALVGWVEMVEASVWMAVLYLPVGLAVLAWRGKLGGLVAAARWSANRALGKEVGERPDATWLIAGPLIAVAGLIGSLTDLPR